jgi:hypothetical protein
MSIILYLLAIVTANVVTAKFAPINLGWIIIPWGTLLIGMTFILRDLVQMKVGRTGAYKTIATAMILSSITSYLLGDTQSIVIASAISFIIAESSDTEIFSRLKASLSKRVLVSGLVGGTLDSAVFAVIGLSPIGAGFLPWSAVPLAIVGQAITKAVMQGLGAAAIAKYEV